MAQNKSDMFWFNDLYILFKNIDEFYPSHDMNLTEKLNSIMRLSIYVGIILTLVCNNYLYLYVPIVIGGFTIFIFNTQKDKIENFFGEYQKLDCESKKPCVPPTTDNPFMNFNNITDDRYRPPACKSYNNKTLKGEIENKFNYNLYRDVSDLYSKNNSQREYYTMPSTTATNDQTSYAKWLYYSGPTCKEDTTKCAPEWTPLYTPIDTTQIFENYVNN